MIVGQREESIAGLNPMQRKKRTNGGSAHRTTGTDIRCQANQRMDGKAVSKLNLDAIDKVAR